MTSDVRFALRWLRRSPGFAAIAIGSLALGIGFNAALFTIVDAVLFRPLPVERSDRLAEVYVSGGDGDQYATSSYPDLQDFKARNEVFSDMLAYSPAIAAVTLTERPRLAMGETVTGNYFQLLGVRAALGRTLLPEDDRAGAPRVVVISHKLWRREFGGDPNVVTKNIRIHGQLYSIVGVAPPEFTGMVRLIAPEVWTPMAYVDEIEPGGIISTVPSPTGNTRLERRGQRWMFVKGRLKTGATVEAAAANLRLIGKQLQTEYPQTNKDREVSVLATNSVHIHPAADRALVPVAGALMLVVGLVLLIACANVASMLLARASGRQREIGIRLAIGASRRRIIKQMLSETLVLAVLGGVAAIGLAWTLMRLVLAIPLPIPIPLSFALQIDLRVVLFTSVVALLAAVIAGLAPAVKATSLNLVGELKGDAAMARAGSRRWTLRDALVVTQIAVTTVLLVAAGLLTRSLFAAQQIGIGFRTAGVAVVSTDLGMIGYDSARVVAFYDRLLGRLRSLPDVESAAMAERVPFSINYNRNNVFFPDRHGPSDKGLILDVTRVTPEYFGTLGVPILQGRNFNSADTPKSPRVAVVNEIFAQKFWPSESAIGKRFRLRGLDGPEVEIVGVAANHKVSSLGETPTPYIHYALTQQPDAGQTFLVRGRGDAAAALNVLRREIAALEPNAVLLDNQTMDSQVEMTLMPAKLGAMSVGVVGVVAMALAAIGLYGVIAYAVARRSREIGIRMALGARPASVVALVLKQGFGLALVGLGVGAVIAFGAATALGQALYGISVVDPIAWGATIAVLLTVAALANVVPARRAAIVDPSTALRAE